MTRRIDPAAAAALEVLQSHYVREQMARADPAEAFAHFISTGLPGSVCEPILEEMVRERFALRQDASRGPLSDEPLELPTSLESPTWYRQMVSIADRIEAFHREAGMDSSYTQPLLGSAWSGRLQALAYPAGGTQPVILVERGLFEFLYSFLKIYVASLPSEIKAGTVGYVMERAAVDAHIMQHKAVIGVPLGRLLKAYLVDGKLGSVILPAPRSEHVPLLSVLLDATETMFVAHEYGHLQAGHFSLTAKTRRFADDSDVDEFVLSQLEELEADCHAAFTMTALLIRRGHTIALAPAAIALFTTLPAMINRSITLMMDGAPRDVEHPRYPNHFERAHAALEIVARFPSAPPYEQLLDGCINHVNAIGLMFVCAQVVLFGLREAGMRPLPEWIAACSLE